ncbi:sigma-70 family RNA polymerase sigma factor [Afipia sp. 1NLS2]|uniref:sigma-70 family RNA polymerase sigma factor n=1 Tax=Afipia sp. 1NLS2 TaxID=666684 RepID=UPI0018DD9CF3|nr:sigma-70 family RNA polymerase sigma factor [Afipia sp. 1NLS2]
MSDILQLIEPLLPALRRYARALLRDQVRADDLVQDALERVVSHWDQRRTDRDTRAWVFAILHNLAMTSLKRINAPSHLSIDEVAEDAFASAPSQENGMRYRELLKVLVRLPEDQRAVLLLVGVEDLSYADTARVLDIPIGTVMSRLSRARERLANEMESDGVSRLASGHLRRVK